MTYPMRPHPANVPTLTEVIELTPEGQPIVPAPRAVVESPLLAPDVEFQPIANEPDPVAAVPVLAPTLDPAPPEPPESEVSEAQLAHRVLTDVQRQIDSMLDFRLRESMQPLLAQFTETLMQDLRDELSRTMRDVVTRAVAQEMAKLRNR